MFSGILLPPDCSVPRETHVKLEAYERLLVRWQKKINLVSPKSMSDLRNRHIADSMQLLSYLPKDPHIRIADIGSGAGFPGLVLAMCGYKDVHLIESDRKKVEFLREVARITQIQVTIHHARAEDVSLADISVFTSRACSNLLKLLYILYQNWQENAFCLFHKGGTYSKELHEAEKDWDFQCTALPSRTDPQGVILNLSHIVPKHAKNHCSRKSKGGGR